MLYLQLHFTVKSTLMNLKKITWLILSAIFISFNTSSFAQSQVHTQAIKFGRLLRLVESRYIDTTNIEQLTEKAIIKLLAELDPHSIYISAEDVAKMNEPIQGSFEGIGIHFNILKDTLFVTDAIPGGPSEKTGLTAGDRIIYVDGKLIAGIGLVNDDVFKMLKGDKGTKVNLKVQRRGEKELLDFVIIRDKIPVYSLDAAYMLDKKTGYVKLNRFSNTTIKEFDEAFARLKNENIENLILDLRGNGGGLLQAAFKLADHFIDNFKMIVYTQGMHSPKKEYKSSGEGDFEKGRLIVLIDEGSASASEIMAGAVQDWDRGIIMGRRSFGKGLVQQPYMLTDGSMVRLTTANYYTPSGRCIQRSYENGARDYRLDSYIKRIESGELFHKDSIQVADSLKYKTKVLGRTVYGGGGIIPDIFIPADTSSHYRYFNTLIRKNVLYPTVLTYIEKNRDRLTKQYNDYESFSHGFTVPDSLIDEMAKEGEKEGIERDNESIVFLKERMKKQIKALISRDVLNDRQNFIRELNTDDKTIKKALELLNNKGEYNMLLSAPKL